MLKLDKIKLSLGQANFSFNINFKAQKIHAIIGRSGSGKSTLLNLVAGFENPEQGDISWNEKSILSQQPHQRPITNLFQEHNLFAHLNMFDNIAIGLSPNLKLSTEQVQLVNTAINSVGLNNMQTKKPKDLSGGEAQRVALARALARAQDQQTPRPLLLLDEPFSALDPETRLEMRDLITTIQKNLKLTVLIISHNPTEMLDFADEITLIADGKIAIQHDLSQAKLPKILAEFIHI
ncbi:MAG: ATP-binding cassette domain-containing protein [Alphaproteobacteria bacterium]|nr:ATP-binding cassette domain-containing protein [Alphaproteobacteria bacterium]